MKTASVTAYVNRGFDVRYTIIISVYAGVSVMRLSASGDPNSGLPLNTSTS